MVSFFAEQRTIPTVGASPSSRWNRSNQLTYRGLHCAAARVAVYSGSEGADTAAKSFAIASHALWRLPSAMTWSAPGGVPWMRYPAVSFAAAVRLLRSEAQHGRT